MPKIISSLNDDQFAIPNQSQFQPSIGQQGMKKFVVEDPTMSSSVKASPKRGMEGLNMPENAQFIDPRQAAEMRRQAQENMCRNEAEQNQHYVTRIEILTGLGRKTKDVQIDGVNCTLRTLKSFEQKLVSEKIEKAERSTNPTTGAVVGFTPTSLNEIKKETLTHSLYLIDGQSIEVVLGVSNYDFTQQYQARKQLINNMDDILLDHLFLKYQELNREAYDGYAPKTEEEVKEVAKAIHKSGQDT